MDKIVVLVTRLSSLDSYHIRLGVIISFFSYDLQESQCSAEFEWHTDVICVKHTNSRDSASSSKFHLKRSDYGKQPCLSL